MAGLYPNIVEIVGPMGVMAPGGKAPAAAGKPPAMVALVYAADGGSQEVGVRVHPQR